MSTSFRMLSDRDFPAMFAASPTTATVSALSTAEVLRHPPLNKILVIYPARKLASAWGTLRRLSSSDHDVYLDDARAYCTPGQHAPFQTQRELCTQTDPWLASTLGTSLKSSSIESRDTIDSLTTAEAFATLTYVCERASQDAYLACPANIVRR